MSAEQECIRPSAMIFSKNGRTVAIDSPARMEILGMVMGGEKRFDELVKELGKAKSTVSVHLHDLIDSGIISERTDESDARRKYLFLDAEYLGTISHPEYPAFPGPDERPLFSGDMRPAAVFRLIFNTIRTSLLQSGVNIEPVLFNAGVRAGNEVAELVTAETEQAFFDNLYDFFLSGELGEITVEQADPFIITVRNCYECQDLPKIGRPTCSFDCGLLTSVFSRQTGEEVDVTETHCYAAGDPFCRFVIQKKAVAGPSRQKRT